MEFIIDLPKDKTNVWENFVPIVKSEDGKEIHIYLTENIDVPAAYNEACFVLSQADESTTTTIHINNGGGIIDSAFMFIDAVKTSKSSTIAKISGTVASAATVITLACDSIIIADYTSFMIHNYSAGTQGKGHEMKAYMDFNNSELNDAFRAIYGGFLTPDEMEAVIDGKDMWMGKAETLSRWENMKAQS